MALLERVQNRLFWRTCGELVQEVEEVVGVLPGGIEADDEGDGRDVGGKVLESLAQLGVAIGRLGEGQFGGGRLVVVAEEGGVVAVA